MADIVSQFIQITKKIGGPDYSSHVIYSERKYGIHRPKIHKYANLVSDPVFGDAVRWIEQNFEKECVLDPNHIISYENILKSSNRKIFEKDLDIILQIPDQDAKYSTIEELDIELKEMEVLYGLMRREAIDLERQEENLKLYLSQLNTELEINEKKNIHNMENMDKYVFQLSSSHNTLISTAHDTVETISKLKDNTQSPIKSHYDYTHNEIKQMVRNRDLNTTHLIFDIFFKDINNFNFEYLIDKTFKNINNTLNICQSVSSYFNFKNSMEFKKIYANLKCLIDDENLLTSYSKDLLKLNYLNELASAQSNALSSSVQIMNSFGDSNIEGYNIPSENITSINALEIEVKELANEIYSIYRSNLEHFIEASIHSESITIWLNNNSSLLSDVKKETEKIKKIVNSFTILVWISQNRYHDYKDMTYMLDSFFDIINTLGPHSYIPQKSQPSITDV
ncbi:hypothetical protein HZS_4062, partial [Henneguya salminicola]